MCEKDRGWWQKEGEPQRQGLQLVSMPSVRGSVCVCVYVFVSGKHRPEKGDCVHVCESTHLSMLRRSKRVGMEIKGKIK